MAKKNFEESLTRLEQITEELESGDLSLEESLKRFDEGIKLTEYCNRKLSEARTRVNVLLKKNDGFSEEPFPGFDPEENDDTAD
ncbi:MAG: exodeoxyribonuclease VII small subunit [Proteobacteria bacterium]|nr:exodeoxyribonuclease VII small subunit [Pseudomonadota bacterium]MBU1739272.1 exodeoxyribonuclease VII small subunit [Pseudomonadota bacterium]